MKFLSSQQNAVELFEGSTGEICRGLQFLRLKDRCGFGHGRIGAAGCEVISESSSCRREEAEAAAEARSSASLPRQLRVLQPLLFTSLEKVLHRLLVPRKDDLRIG